MKEDIDKSQEAKGTWADTFLIVGLLIICGLSGVFLGLYWRVLVLDYFISTDNVFSDKLLIVLYLPVGVLALVIGFTWFFCVHKLFQSIGVKVMDIPQPDEKKS